MPAEPCPTNLARLRRGAGARASAFVVALLGGAAPLALTACDPCSGVVGCSASPRLGVSGQIVDRGTPTNADRNALSGALIPQARPVAGARVEVVAAGGVALEGTQAAAATDANGWWQVALPASGVGDAWVDVRVTAPGTAGYLVRGVPVRASRVRGDGNVLGRWTRERYLTYIGEVWDHATWRPVDGAVLSAVRTGGVEVAPTANFTEPMVSFGGGRFLYDVRPLTDGPVVLDFTITRPGLAPTTVRGVALAPKHEWLPPNVDPELLFLLDSAGNRR